MVGYRELLPAGFHVRRAREFRLYGADGTRLTDWWQGDGAAALGHRPPGVIKAVKAELERGLLAPVPTRWDGRLDRWLRLLAEIAGVAQLLIVAPGAGTSRREAAVSADSSAAGTGAPPARWEPFAGSGAPAAQTAETAAAVATIVLPDGLGAVPGGSAALTAAACAGAAALHRYLTGEESAARSALAAQIALPAGYSRRGAVLVADSPADSEAYETWRRFALTRDVVLPPSADDPIRVPHELGRVELIRWQEVVDEWSN